MTTVQEDVVQQGFTYRSCLPPDRISYGDQMAVVPKITTKDTTLTVSNADGGWMTFPVPSGTDFGIHATGLHYNPMLCGRCIPVRFLIESHDAVLEGSSQIYAREVPRCLTKGCLYFL